MHGNRLQIETARKINSGYNIPGEEIIRQRHVEGQGKLKLTEGLERYPPRQ